MTFQQFQKSWWSWLLFVTIIVVVGFARGWDKLALWCAGVLVVTGILRLFSRQTRGFAVRQMAKVLAKMAPEQRERELQRLAPDQREQVLRELEGHTAEQSGFRQRRDGASVPCRTLLPRRA